MNDVIKPHGKYSGGELVLKKGFNKSMIRRIFVYSRLILAWGIRIIFSTGFHEDTIPLLAEGIDENVYQNWKIDFAMPIKTSEWCSRSTANMISLPRTT